MEFDFSAFTSKKLHNIVITNIDILIISTELFAHCFNNEWKAQRQCVGGMQLLNFEFDGTYSYHFLTADCGLAVRHRK
jgi:hypothetical protein